MPVTMVPLPACKLPCVALHSSGKSCDRDMGYRSALFIEQWSLKLSVQQNLPGEQGGGNQDFFIYPISNLQNYKSHSWNRRQALDLLLSLSTQGLCMTGVS